MKTYPVLTLGQLAVHWLHLDNVILASNLPGRTFDVRDIGTALAGTTGTHE